MLPKHSHTRSCQGLCISYQESLCVISHEKYIPVRLVVGSSCAGRLSGTPALGVLHLSDPAGSASPLTLALDKEFKESLVREREKVRETGSID